MEINKENKLKIISPTISCGQCTKQAMYDTPSRPNLCTVTLKGDEFVSLTLGSIFPSPIEELRERPVITLQSITTYWGKMLKL